MRKYKLLKESDIIPNNSYLAIVYYPYPSPNRNAMTEFIYVDEYRDICGTSKDVNLIVDESIIGVLFEENPERAYEIIQGGYVEDGMHNDLLNGYDFRLKEKLNEWLLDALESEE